MHIHTITIVRNEPSAPYRCCDKAIYTITVSTSPQNPLTPVIRKSQQNIFLLTVTLDWDSKQEIDLTKETKGIRRWLMQTVENEQADSPHHGISSSRNPVDVA
ncbi:hypothetical protein Tcan_10558 [Toxocara canis]|uniref:Uncharacterized protein n=1 Tax=Toxocara canis TaxID=6265 RepID=A0A0B2UYH5_TOXCA|nr:hypothetical protein Tcan_10558 [Toxocara canis]